MVGYGRPPRHTQFKEGQSGNPRGRRKGARGAKTLLTRTLDEPIEVTENGQRRTVQKREAVFKALAAKAMKGDTRAIGLLLAHMKELEGEDPDNKLPVVIQRFAADKMSNAEWEKKYGSAYDLAHLEDRDIERMTDEQLDKFIERRILALGYFKREAP